LPYHPTPYLTVVSTDKGGTYDDSLPILHALTFSHITVIVSPHPIDVGEVGHKLLMTLYLLQLLSSSSQPPQVVSPCWCGRRWGTFWRRCNHSPRSTSYWCNMLHKANNKTKQMAYVSHDNYGKN